MRNVLATIAVLLFIGSACAQEQGAPGVSPGVESTLSSTQRVELARRQGLVGCRLEVAYAEPRSDSSKAILEDIAADLEAESSEPDDIAEAFAIALLGAEAPRVLIEAASEGCVRGLRNALRELQG